MIALSKYIRSVADAKVRRRSFPESKENISSQARALKAPEITKSVICFGTLRGITTGPFPWEAEVTKLYCQSPTGYAGASAIIRRVATGIATTGRSPTISPNSVEIITLRVIQKPKLVLVPCVVPSRRWPRCEYGAFFSKSKQPIRKAENCFDRKKKKARHGPRPLYFYVADQEVARASPFHFPVIAPSGLAGNSRILLPALPRAAGKFKSAGRAGPGPLRKRSETTPAVPGKYCLLNGGKLGPGKRYLTQSAQARKEKKKTVASCLTFLFRRSARLPGIAFIHDPLLFFFLSPWPPGSAGRSWLWLGAPPLAASPEQNTTGRGGN